MITFQDLIFSLVFQRRIEALRQQMAEEDLNLKAILEKNSPIG